MPANPARAQVSLPPNSTPASSVYRVVHIQSEPPRQPFNGLIARRVARHSRRQTGLTPETISHDTAIRTYKSPDRLPVLTATKHAEATRRARDQVSKTQQWEWKPELAKILPNCRYAKPLYNTVTYGIGHTPIKAKADESFCSHPPAPVVRVAAEPSGKTYTLELDARLQVRGGLVTHLAQPNAGNHEPGPSLADQKKAQLSQCWRFGREVPAELSEQDRDELRSASWKREHAGIVRTLEVLRESPSPALAIGALLLSGDPVADFTEWLAISGNLNPGTPLANVSEEVIFRCPPASAIANCSDSKLTKIVLNAKSLWFDYRHPVSLSRWIASGETRSWLTLGAVASTQDDETRFMGLGKTFMSWEEEDRTDGMRDESATLEFDAESWETVTMARVQSRRRELQRKLSSHGDKRELADVGIRYARGMTQQAIAETLGINLAAVRRYIAWCHSKLGWMCFYRGVSKEIIRESVRHKKFQPNKASRNNHLVIVP